MRVDVLARDPGIGCAHIDAELLVEFTGKRACRALARLDLAAGKFPIAGVYLAARPLREQDAPVRPLREPRCSDHCKASSRAASLHLAPSVFSQCATMARYSSWSKG